MKPVFQNKFGSQGNCSSACLASLFEIPLEQVPNFNHDVEEGMAQDNPTVANNYWDRFTEYVNSMGYHHFIITGRTAGDVLTYGWLKGYHLVGGKSPRGTQHLVIYQGTELIHDPHPEGGGVIPECVIVLIPKFNEVYHAKKGESK